MKDMTDGHKCEYTIEIEMMAEMIAATDIAVALATTYSQVAHEVGFLGNGIRLKIPLPDFIETLKVWWSGSHEIHVDGIICPHDSHACIEALTKAGSKVAEWWEVEPKQVLVSIPSMTHMGVEA